MYSRYSGWGGVIFLCVIGLVGMLVLISVGGPWYHDCSTKDCSTQYYYGVYCEEYCLYGNYGPGNNSLAVFLVVGGFLCLIPLCSNTKKKEKEILERIIIGGGGSTNVSSIPHRNSLIF